MAKSQSKSATKKKRKKKHRPGAHQGGNADTSNTLTNSGGGAMRRMVGGFRRAVGVEDKAKKGAGDYIWTILLVLGVAAILFWKFRTD